MINPISFILSPFKLYAAAGTIIALSVVVGVHLYLDRGVRIERDTAVADLDSYKTKIEVATALQVAENLAKDKAHFESATNLQTQYADAVKKLGLANQTTETLRKDLQNDKAIINRALANADKLRIKPFGSDASLSKIPTAAELLAQSGDDSNATLARVTRACQVTTNDYNALWNSWTNNCAIYGCK